MPMLEFRKQELSELRSRAGLCTKYPLGVSEFNNF